MGFVAVFIVFILFIPSTSALANPGLTVKVSSGIDGKAKYDKGAPISITVENSGAPFSGDLVVDIMEFYQQGMGRTFPIELGTGETKTVSFFVNNMEGIGGAYGSTNQKSIFFYEGGWKKGKEVEHAGAQSLTATMYYDEKMIVTFTNNVDRLTALKSVDIGPSSNTQLIDSEKIGLTNLPTDPRGWDVIDYIILDEFSFADLQSEKQLAVLEWVKNGGIIVVGSSESIEDEVGVFSSYLPLKLSEKGEIVPLALNDWASTTGFDAEIQLFSSELSEGAFALLMEGEQILVAHKKLGQGLVMQTAFSFGDEPIASSPGMTAFWNTLLNAGEDSIMSPYKNMYNPLNEISHMIGSSNELFPSFKVSAPLIFGIIALYIILIIPVLYFILKRKDKREYAWWIIPAIALITSIAIFGYGAKDRIGRSQIQHTAVLSAENDGNVSGYFAESILSNKSGDYSFKAPHGTSLLAAPQYSMFGGSGNMLHKQALLENDASTSTLHFRNVGYWNVASIYGETNIKDIGKMSNNLTVNKGVLSGSITNNFPFVLTDVAIWAGNDFIPLDDINAGETIEITETLKSILKPRSNYYGGYQATGNDDLMEMRKNNSLAFYSDYMGVSNKPVIIGYTDTKVVPVELEDVNSTLSAITMIVQPVQSEMVFKGEITLDEYFLEMYMIVSDDDFGHYVIDDPIMEQYMDGVQYEQNWRLPEELELTKIAWSSLKVTNLDHKLYTSKILNVQTGEYEIIDSDELLLKDNISDYLSNDGTLSISIIFNNGQYSNGEVLPKLELVGEVAK